MFRLLPVAIIREYTKFVLGKSIQHFPSTGIQIKNHSTPIVEAILRYNYQRLIVVRKKNSDSSKITVIVIRNNLCTYYVKYCTTLLSSELKTGQIQTVGRQFAIERWLLHFLLQCKNEPQAICAKYWNGCTLQCSTILSVTIPYEQEDSS